MTPSKAVVPFSISGLNLILAYDFNAICDAEAVTGINLLAALETLNDLTAVQLRGLLYAAIVSTPRLSVRECGELIRVDAIGPITQALAQAYRLAMLTPQPETEEAPAPAPEAGPSTLETQ